MYVIFPTFSISGDFFPLYRPEEKLENSEKKTAGFLFTLTCCMKEYIIRYVYYYYRFYSSVLAREDRASLKIMRIFLFIKVIFYFPFQWTLLNYFIYAENIVMNVANKTTEEGENHFRMTAL